MNGKSRSISPLVARKNDLLKVRVNEPSNDLQRLSFHLQRDSVATQDVRQAIISRRLAADTTSAEDRDTLERQLAAAIQVTRFVLSLIDTSVCWFLATTTD